MSLRSCFRFGSAALGLAFLVLGCQPQTDPPFFNGNREAYRPIYISREAMEKIEVLAPQPLRKPGKIYVRGQFLFINELNQGVHVLDNADPKNPQKLSFLRIPGNVDIAAKGNVLYADNLSDLLAFDISEPTAARLVKRVANVFPQYRYPPTATWCLSASTTKKAWCWAGKNSTRPRSMSTSLNVRADFGELPFPFPYESPQTFPPPPAGQYPARLRWLRQRL